jgi:hypothetical protein
MKISQRLLSTLVIAVFLISLSAKIGVSETLTGTVVDNVYSNPVADVAVSVFNSDSTLAGMDTTGVDGAYVLTLNPGDYFAEFSKENYADTTITDITIVSGGTTVVDLTFRFVHNCSYVIGDVNGSSSLNGLDVNYGIAYFKSGMNPPLNCLCECTPGHFWYVCGDVNGDCIYNGFDITYLVAMYVGRLPIPCPDCPPAD